MAVPAGIEINDIFGDRTGRTLVHPYIDETVRCRISCPAPGIPTRRSIIDRVAGRSLKEDPVTAVTGIDVVETDIDDTGGAFPGLDINAACSVALIVRTAVIPRYIVIRERVVSRSTEIEAIPVVPGVYIVKGDVDRSGAAVTQLNIGTVVDSPGPELALGISGLAAMISGRRITVQGVI